MIINKNICNIMSYNINRKGERFEKKNKFIDNNNFSNIYNNYF
jgi:hypothetical protein